jgi:hypothetical protein
MPLLHLKLLPIAEGSNECEINLPHEIRSQVFKYKKSLISVIPDENVAADADGDSDNLDLFPQGCVMVDLPFFTGYEITSNVGGGGLLPICCGNGGRGSWMGSTSLTQRRTDMESEYHINLKAEEIPSTFRCRILKADGLTPQPMTLKTLGGQTDTETGFVRQIDLFFEYETNNLFF